jgi:dUTP pyrophosphatase
MDLTIKLKLRPLPHHLGLPLPEYQSPEAAGLDLAAANEADICLNPGERQLIPTGLTIELPKGYEAQIRPRSGLAIKHGVTVLNTPGTIDSDYRGEVKIILINLGDTPFTINRGMRIAQMVVAPVLQADIHLCPKLGESERGQGGFGHSGK